MYPRPPPPAPQPSPILSPYRSRRTAEFCGVNAKRILQHLHVVLDGLQPVGDGHRGLEIGKRRHGVLKDRRGIVTSGRDGGIRSPRGRRLSFQTRGYAPGTTDRPPGDLGSWNQRCNCLVEMTARTHAGPFWVRLRSPASNHGLGVLRA